MISQFEDSLITTVRKALIDVLPDVRHAAALTFENLHNTIGHRALDGVLPNVFEQLVRFTLIVLECFLLMLYLFEITLLSS